MVPHPRKAPSSRRLQERIAYVIEHGAGPRRQFARQASTQKRFRHKHREPALGGCYKSRRSRLVALSSVVVLDLAKIPVIRVEHRQEVRRTAVIRKTYLANTPRSLLVRNPVLDTQRYHALPLRGRGDVVHEVVVDMVSPQTVQLLIKKAIEILRTFARSVRQLGRKQNPVAQTQALKRSSHTSFVTGVEIGRVQIGYSLLHRTGNDGIGRLRIGVSRCTGKPHATQPQRRDTVAAFGVNAILHCLSSPLEALMRRNTTATPSKHIRIAIENVS